MARVCKTHSTKGGQYVKPGPQSHARCTVPKGGDSMYSLGPVPRQMHSTKGGTVCTAWAQSHARCTVPKGGQYVQPGPSPTPDAQYQRGDSMYSLGPVPRQMHSTKGGTVCTAWAQSHARCTVPKGGGAPQYVQPGPSPTPEPPIVLTANLAVSRYWSRGRQAERSDTN